MRKKDRWLLPIRRASYWRSRRGRGEAAGQGRTGQAWQPTLALLSLSTPVPRNPPPPSAKVDYLTLTGALYAAMRHTLTGSSQPWYVFHSVTTVILERYYRFDQ